ncbi:hypothetical protein HJC23_000582 [Cyclotella cryptica]|uniref:Uncharacterized protein n=1 Tax=Cyclotella cryptica TaxID=29204 RepID=A0ABD3NGH8_9STRA
MLMGLRLKTGKQMKIKVMKASLLLFSVFSHTTAFSRPRIHHVTTYHGSAKIVTSVPRGGSFNPSNIILKSSLIATIDAFYQTMPLTSAFLTCALKASAGTDFMFMCCHIIIRLLRLVLLADLVAQKTQAAKDRGNDDVVAPFHKKRNLAFFLYGGLYQGMAQEIIFNEFFPFLFGQGSDTFTVASKVVFDSFIVSPLLCLPVAYLVKSLIFQYSLGKQSRFTIRM